MKAKLKKIEFGKNRPKKQAEISIWRREQMILAALHCVAEGGISHATVERVTAKAKVSRGMVRHYFRNKDDMLLASYQYLCDLYKKEILDNRNDPSRAPSDELFLLVRYTFENKTMEDLALSCWFSFWGAARTDSRFRKIYKHDYSWYRSYVLKIVSSLMNLPETHTLVRTSANGFVALTSGLWLEISIDPDEHKSETAISVCEEYIQSISHRSPEKA